MFHKIGSNMRKNISFLTFKGCQYFPSFSVGNLMKASYAGNQYTSDCKNGGYTLLTAGTTTISKVTK